MSRTAQGVTAVKQCRLPPLFGYKTAVPQGAVRTLSTTTFANLTAQRKTFIISLVLSLLNVGIKNQACEPFNTPLGITII